ncbi:MAG: cobalamin B12-binding domain-containing protein, partial [Pseudomonadota bacterium]
QERLLDYAIGELEEDRMTGLRGDDFGGDCAADWADHAQPAMDTDETSFKALRKPRREKSQDHDISKRGEAANPGASPKRSVSALIEAEVLPRLLLTHELIGAKARDRATSRSHVSPRLEPTAFAKASLRLTAQELAGDLMAAFEAGLSRETILLETLAPAARALGVMWENDECTFTDVTVGVGRLHEVMRRLRMSDGDLLWGGGERSAYLAASPGEQHTFGLVIVEDFLARAGWRVDCDLRASADDVCEAVESQHYDMAGFTLGDEERLPDLKRLIRKVRKCAANADLVILVGGQIFGGADDLAPAVGADAVIDSARDAAWVADRLLHRKINTGI